MDIDTKVKMSESGQFEIPPAIRQILHWEGAMELAIRVTPSGLLIEPAHRRHGRRRLEELRGFLKHTGAPLSDEELNCPVDLAGNP